MEMYSKEKIMKAFDYELGTQDKMSNDIFAIILQSFKRVVNEQCTIDAEVVVRCKDCAWSTDEYDGEMRCCAWGWPAKLVNGEGFCNQGKKSFSNENGFCCYGSKSEEK